MFYVRTVARHEGGESADRAPDPRHHGPTTLFNDASGATSGLHHFSRRGELLGEVLNERQVDNELHVQHELQVQLSGDGISGELRLITCESNTTTMSKSTPSISRDAIANA